MYVLKIRAYCILWKYRKERKKGRKKGREKGREKGMEKEEKGRKRKKEKLTSFFCTAFNF